MIISPRGANLIVDKNVDPGLDALIGVVKGVVRVVEDVLLRVKIVAVLVANALGGCVQVPGVDRPLITTEACDKALTTLKLKYGNNSIPLGELKYGLFKPRSLLFKYIADELGIPCDYVYHSNFTFPVISIDNESFVVDLLKDISQVYVQGPQADFYMQSITSFMSNNPKQEDFPALAKRKTVDVPEEKVGEGKTPRAVETPKKFTDVVLNERLGKGTFGDVYRCRVGGFTCAVKVINIRAMSETALKMTHNELHFLETLQHENIVQFLGHEETPKRELRIFMEYMPLSLTSQIQKRNATSTYFRTRDVVKCAKGMAKALAYLHQKKITHRDIKSSNILVEVDVDLDRIKEIRLCDFGVSKALSEVSVATTFTGTDLWVAPEILDIHFGTNTSYDEKCDIWSFGMVLVEMVTLRPPYVGVPQQQAVQNVRNGILPEIQVAGAPKLDEELEQLILDCLKRNPSERLTANQIVQKLNDM